jgi:hypothetical protein
MALQLLRGINSLAQICLAGWINTWVAKNGNMFSIAVSPYALGMPMSPVLRYLLGIGVPYLLRVVLYSGAFKLRSIACSFTGRLVIGGAFILAGLLPLPQFLLLLVMIGVSIVLITKYTEAKVYPDALFISIGVEMTSILAMDFLIAPLIF